jgi:putative endonuclease
MRAKKFQYLYILKLSNGDYYIGRTDDLKRRVKEHTLGQERTTKRFLPCKLVTYVAFDSRNRAIKFEKYLKTGSGFAFRNRHLV